MALHLIPRASRPSVQVSFSFYPSIRMKEVKSIEDAFTAIMESRKADAVATIAKDFPHIPIKRSSRKYTAQQCMKTFLRDGFIDRYSGGRLLYPGALRILSLELPNEFPYQSHWKTTDTHMGYWYFYPTVDHVYPIARGGSNTEDNLVTTSQLRNSAKSHWTLEELGWELHPPGNLIVWDGLLKSAVEYVENNPRLLDDSVLRKWYEATSIIEKDRIG